MSQNIVNVTFYVLYNKKVDLTGFYLFNLIIGIQIKLFKNILPYRFRRCFIMFWLQFITLLLCIFIGARLGGVGLGVMGGVGMAILVFVFHLQPTAPPIDVMLMILAVITAAGALQAARWNGLPCSSCRKSTS